MADYRLINGVWLDPNFIGTRLINGLWVRGNILPIYDQEGFQFRNDDGTEVTATDVGAQDAGMSEDVNVRKRLRILVNVTNVPDPFGYRLEVKKSTDSDASYKVIT